jgi:hypothetical protein
LQHATTDRGSTLQKNHTPNYNIATMEESAKQRFVFFTLFTLGITCLLTSLGTYWTTLTFQTGFSKLSQFHYNMAIGLTKLQTCVLTPFHTKESCSVKTYWELRGDSQGGNDNDGGNNDGGFDNNPLGKLQDRCEDQLIATDLFVFISISTLVIGFGIYLLQDNFEKLTGIGNLPLKIGTTIAAILTTTGTILWAVGGCYLGFKDALEDAHAKISSFPFGNTMAVGDAQVHLSM